MKNNIDNGKLINQNKILSKAEKTTNVILKKALKYSIENMKNKNVDLETDNLDSNKILRKGKMINYSYVMGIDNIDKLQENNFEIKSWGNNYGISFSSDRIEMFENFIFETLQNGFWNEYLGKEKVFIFKFNDGKIKRYVLNKENEKEISK